MTARLDTYRDLLRLIRAEAKARVQCAAEHARICRGNGEAADEAGWMARRREAAEFLRWLDKVIMREVGE